MRDDGMVVPVQIAMVIVSYAFGFLVGAANWDQTEAIKQGHPIVIENQVYRCENGGQK